MKLNDSQAVFMTPDSQMNLGLLRPVDVVVGAVFISRPIDTLPSSPPPIKVASSDESRVVIVVSHLDQVLYGCFHGIQNEVLEWESLFPCGSHDASVPVRAQAWLPPPKQRERPSVGLE